jgi:hypothetical protein
VDPITSALAAGTGRRETQLVSSRNRISQTGQDSDLLRLFRRVLLPVHKYDIVASLPAGRKDLVLAPCSFRHPRPSFLRTLISSARAAKEGCSVKSRRKPGT